MKRESLEDDKYSLEEGGTQLQKATQTSRAQMRIQTAEIANRVLAWVPHWETESMLQHMYITLTVNFFIDLWLHL